MIQNQYDHLDNIIQIKEFLHFYNISRGEFFDSQISVEDCRGNVILVDSCKCYINYNDQYNRFDINVYWTYNDAEMKRNKIKGLYNSRYYKIRFEESNLVIEVDRRFIVIKIE